MKLDAAVAEYVTRKRFHGIAFDDGAKCLQKFSAQLANVPLNRVSTLDLIKHLDESSSTANAWHWKSRIFVKFFEYWAVRGMTPPLLMPPSRLTPIRSFLPYVFKEAEVAALLASTVECQTVTHCALDPRTLHMFVLMLYATGAGSGEMRRLKRQDVQLRSRLIRLQNPRVGSRTIPISTELRDRLNPYMDWRFKRSTNNQYVFMTKREEKLTHTQAGKSFARLCQVAKVERRDGYSARPRIQDFRTTFAVHRITGWIREGANMNRLLPALAAYMGRRSLLSGDTYLRLTPERFRKQLDSLSSAKCTTHWRENSALMGFLAAI